MDTADHFTPCTCRGGGGGNDIQMAFPGMLQASGSDMKEASYFSPQFVYTIPGSGISVVSKQYTPFGSFVHSLHLYTHFQVVFQEGNPTLPHKLPGHIGTVDWKISLLK